MRKSLPAAAFLIFILAACKTTKHTGDRAIRLDTVDIRSGYGKAVYNPSAKRVFDLLHTKLDINFDWGKQYVNGKALLILKPYFYPTDTLTLDAKGFDIHEISLVNKNQKQPLTWNYPEKKQLKIHLPRQYLNSDTLTLYIDYTAKPGEQGGLGGWAISDSKGLYFINPDGKEKSKPQEIWSQGETENNSCWFPTIEAPNERMTQEINITVDSGFTTLSNGLLIKSTDNKNGTRTDYWKQSVPAAPYLTMIAVGKFSVIKDNWRGMEVSYYVEPKYEPYGGLVFGNTPEMIEFFSNRLQVPFPWEKYAQVVVRDFVSGAMENSSATVHGEFIQRTDREYLDDTYEDYISHELFHQWFGDLVTCESWANIPLNESFATYGEYLWREYKYGREEADQHLNEDLENYLRESKRKKVNLIRYDYDDREDMFDSHSYAKGGRILHMLRKYTGDEAFFKSIELYLKTNKFSPVEIHHLRLAFEQVTGEDLNWFFNQWFFAKGHPEMIIGYQYDDSLKQEIITIGQVQDLSTTPLYRLPLVIDIYAGGIKTSRKITVNGQIERYTFDVPVKPDLVNTDAEKMLLCTKLDLKTDAMWKFQYYNAPLFIDRFEALDYFSKNDELTGAPATLITDALNDSHWFLRLEAMENIKKIKAANKISVTDKLIDLALHDEKAKVRSKAVSTLAEWAAPDLVKLTPPEKDKLITVFKTALNDRAYSVVGEALAALVHLNKPEALQITKPFENETNENIILAVARIYGELGTREQSEFFKNKIDSLNDYKKMYIMQEYAGYLLNQDDETINTGLPLLEGFARTEKSWWRRLKAIELIEQLYDEYKERESETEQQIKKSGKGGNEYNELQGKLKQVQMQKEKINSMLSAIFKDEKDNRVLMFYKSN